MKIFPTKKQWSKWSLPAKAGYCSLWIGVIAFIVAIILHNSNIRLSNQQAEKNREQLEEFEKKLEEIKYELVNDNKINQLALDELIKLFNLRAVIINEELSIHYKYTNVNDFLNQFNILHEKHIEALQNHEFILAHDYLKQIYNISYMLTQDEFWTSHKIERPGVFYHLRHDAFTKGELICGYLVGKVKSYSDKIDLVYNILDFGRRQRWIIEDIQYDGNILTEDDILTMYEFILRNCKM
jgi:hypothetical protein